MKLTKIADAILSRRSTLNEAKITVPVEDVNIITSKPPTGGTPPPPPPPGPRPGKSDDPEPGVEYEDGDDDDGDTEETGEPGEGEPGEGEGEGEGEGTGEGEPGEGEPGDTVGESESELRKKVEDMLDQRTDSHATMNEEGKNADDDLTDGKTLEDIIKNNKRNREKLLNKQDSKKPQPKKEKVEGDYDPNAQSDGEPGTGHADSRDIDVNIVPRFNWKAIIKRFVDTAKPKKEETYSKPHRRGVTQAGVIVQTGAGAMKPGEKIMEELEVNLAFVIDNSGSMGATVATIYSNILNLLGTPKFKKIVTMAYKFDTQYEAFKVKLATNQAEKVNSVEDDVREWHETADRVFGSTFGGGTEFTKHLATELQTAMDKKYNIMIFTDSDIFHGSHFDNFMAVLTYSPKQVFCIFDRKSTYVEMRKRGGVNSFNVTYFRED